MGVTYCSLRRRIVVQLGVEAGKKKKNQLGEVLAKSITAARLAVIS